MSSAVSTDPTSQPKAASRKRGCLFYVRRGLLAIVAIVVVLVLLGFGYQSIAVELDKRNYPPPGQLYEVNGHQMHIICTGQGSPAVILQAGGVADSTWWYWVQNQLAEHTRVCAYDRAGYGWSEPTSQSRDVLTLTGELHTLLQKAGVAAPYVMVGHSWGAVLTRIYAAQYPQDVMGITLVDSAILIPKHFADQGEFDQWKSTFGGLDVIFGILTRLGLPRLTDPSTFLNAGYPADIAQEIVALHSRNVVIETDIAEFKDEMWALTEASAAAENLDDLPTAILWAPESWKTTDRQIETAPAARAEISTYSSNSITRDVEGADHISVLGNEQYAQQVSDAILDVIEFFRTGEPLAQ